MRFIATSKVEAVRRNVTGTGAKKSELRDACKLFADFADSVLTESEAEVLYVTDEEGNERGIVWMDFMDTDPLSDDSDDSVASTFGEKLQNAAKKESGGGMKSIAGNINRNFRETHKLRAVYQNAGKTPESGEIVIFRMTDAEVAAIANKKAKSE